MPTLGTRPESVASVCAVAGAIIASSAKKAAARVDLALDRLCVFMVLAGLGWLRLGNKDWIGMRLLGLALNLWAG